EVVLIKSNEDFQDGFREPFIHRKTEPSPIAGGAESLKLLDDEAAEFGFPCPHALNKSLSAKLFARRSFSHELPLDDILCGDPGMVHPRHPQHVASLHATPADQNILDRVVERMADVQGPGDVRRRDDDAVRLARVGGGRMEIASLVPELVPASFNCFRIVRLVELWGRHDLPMLSQRSSSF